MQCTMLVIDLTRSQEACAGHWDRCRPTACDASKAGSAWWHTVQPLHAAAVVAAEVAADAAAAADQAEQSGPKHCQMLADFLMQLQTDYQKPVWRPQKVKERKHQIGHRQLQSLVCFGLESES